MMPQNVMKQLDDKIDTTLTSLLLIWYDTAKRRLA